MAEQQQGGFAFDPFEGTQLSNVMRDEEEEQTLPEEDMTIQVDPPTPPQESAPTEEEVAPTAPEDEDRVVVTPDMVVQYPASPYRTPDPYSSDEEEAQRVQEFFYTPREKGMPKSQADLEQDVQVGNAPFFITPDGTKVDFDRPDLPLTTKYRYMMANDGVAVPLSKPDGSLDREGGGFLRYDLIPAQQYRQYKEMPVRKGALDQAGGFVSDVLVGPTGYGDMQEADTYLKNLGLNQNARTYIMRGIATNEFEFDSIIQGPADMAGFVLSLPAYAQKGVNFLMKDVALPFYSFLSGTDVSDLRKHVEKMQDDQILNYEIPSYSQYIAEKYDMLPEVVEYAIQPQGAISRAGKFLAEDVPLYVAAGLKRTGSALRRMTELDLFMKRNYGGDTFVDALRNAADEGVDFMKIQSDFVTENASRFSADKIQKDLDLAFGLAVMRPGSQQRVELLRPQMDSLLKEKDAIQGDLTVARSQNNKAAIKRAEARAKNINKQIRTIEGDLLLPKYLNDAAKELRGTTAWVTGTTTVYAEFFGSDPAVTPFLEMGGVIGMLTMPKVGQGVTRFSKGALSEIVAARHLLRMDPTSWKEARNSQNMSRGARNALDEIMALPSELRQSFLAGAEEAAVIRRGLIELSEKTGVDINEDAFIENLATLSDIGALVTLSRNISEKVVVTNLGNLAGELQRSQSVMQAQQGLITNMATATRQMLNLKITAGLPDDHPISELGYRMNKFVQGQAQRLEADKQALSEFVAAQGKQLETMVTGGALLKDDKTLEGVNSAIEFMDMQSRAARLDVDPETLAETGLDPSQAMIDAAKTIDSLEQQHVKLVDNLVNNLNKEQAANGDASVVHTVAVAVRKNQILNRVDKMYSSFDKDYPNVRANVGPLYDLIFSSEAQKELSGYLPDEVTSGALSMAGENLYGKTSRGFGSLFNGGAKGGLKLVRQRLGDRAGEFDALLSEMGVEGANPINQFMRIKTVLDDPNAEEARDAYLKFFGGNEQSARDFSENLPMLITTADWRLVNKHLNKMAGKGGDNAGMYMALKDRWQEVGQKQLDDGQGNKVNNPIAFQVGWFGEQAPSNVADEVYEEFRAIQDFYRYEYAERYYYDPRVSKLNGTHTQPRQEAAASVINDAKEGEELDIANITPTYSAVQKELKPNNALNYLYGNVLQAKVAYGGEDLYTNVIEPLAKQVGMYDANTGRYRIVVESADKEDANAVKVANASRKSVLRWLQGELVKTKGGRQVVQRDARGRPLLDIGETFEYNRAGFDSFANVPVFRKNADGSFTEVGKLVEQEEAFNAISIDALEMNRYDLDSTFSEAYNVLGSWQKGALTSVKNAGASVKADHDFVNDFMRTYAISPTQGVTNIDLTAERVFGAVVSGTFEREMAGEAVNLSKIKELMVKSAKENGMDGDDAIQYVDEAVARLVNRHIQTVSSSVASRMGETIKDGEIVRMPVTGLDGRSILESIGAVAGGDPEKAGRIRAIIGDDAYQTWDLVGRTVMRIQQERVPGVDGRLPGLSLDSILSRIYNINRQVVSTQWVATEMLIRAGRQAGGKLLQTMLTDPKIAKEILDIIETGKIPKYRVEPDWIRALSFEIVRQEAANEDAATRFAGSVYYDYGPVTRVGDLPDRPVPTARTPGTPFGTTPTGETTLPSVEPTPPPQPEPLDPIQQQMRALGRNPNN